MISRWSAFSLADPAPTAKSANPITASLSPATSETEIRLPFTNAPPPSRAT